MQTAFFVVLSSVRFCSRLRASDFRTLSAFAKRCCCRACEGREAESEGLWLGFRRRRRDRWVRGCMAAQRERWSVVWGFEENNKSGWESLLRGGWVRWEGRHIIPRVRSPMIGETSPGSWLVPAVSTSMMARRWWSATSVVCGCIHIAAVCPKDWRLSCATSARARRRSSKSWKRWRKWHRCWRL